MWVLTECYFIDGVLFYFDFDQSFNVPKNFTKNFEFHEIPCNVNRFIPCGHTDGGDEADNRSPKLFCAGPSGRAV